MAQYIDIAGAEELLRRLKQLPSKLHRNIMRGALRAGAKPIMAAAKANVPTDSGALKGTIRLRTGAERRLFRSTVSAQVVAGSRAKGGAFYAHIVEGGSKPHIIKARRKPLALGRGRFTRRVKHPGAKARPFMRPALEQHADRALTEMGRYIAKRLDKAIK